MKMNVYNFIASWFYAGFIPKAPGTFGSIAAIPFAFILMYLFGNFSLFCAAIALFFIGVKISDKIILNTKINDPQFIVIDEVVGIFITLIPVNLSWQNLIAAFILFRFFDILKPFPVSWADKKLSGGLGVMLDDVLAGIYASICLLIINLWAIY